MDWNPGLTIEFKRLRLYLICFLITTVSRGTQIHQRQKRQIKIMFGIDLVQEAIKNLDI